MRDHWRSAHRRSKAVMNIDVLDWDTKEFAEFFGLIPPEMWAEAHKIVYLALSKSGCPGIRRIERYPGSQGRWEVIATRTFGDNLASLLEEGRRLRRALCDYGVPVARETFRLSADRTRMILEFVNTSGEPGHIRYLPGGRKEFHRCVGALVS